MYSIIQKLEEFQFRKAMMNAVMHLTIFPFGQHIYAFLFGINLKVEFRHNRISSCSDLVNTAKQFQSD